jgi:NAD-dependent deacetylase
MVFSGAGLSKESGVETFRDSGGDGLWNKHKIEDVATPEGWRKDKELVLNFYNARRSQLKEVEPNDAHKYIAKLEEKFDVINITQNVDNLLERAGSTNVIHLHGDLTKSRSALNSKLVYDCDGDIQVYYLM